MDNSAGLPVIRTERLLLRPWKDTDFEPFARMNADPNVMNYFPRVLTKEESNDLATRISNVIKENGWGFWAVEVPGEASFIGFIGLGVPRFEAHFMPAIEIGWRLAHDHWGKGYATEGALAVLKYAFETLGIPEIVSYTAVVNVPSQKVMQKIGMTHDVDGDFDHPKVAEGHELRRHVLYRIKKDNKD